jgi:glycosyltransferase involved in cell wall biosynthesis
MPKDGSAQLLSTAKPVALLLYSHFFAPSIGGVETIVLSLARGLAERRDSNGAAQFKITLVTQTPAGNWNDRELPFRVIRKPDLFQLWRLIRSCDLVHVAGPALAPLFLTLVAGKPVIVEHHGFQTICPNGQLLIEPAGTPCPGHFMASRHAKCLRCNSSPGWLVSYKLWLLTFVRRFLCARAAVNITPTQWLGGLLHLPRAVPIPHGVEFAEAPAGSALLNGMPVIVFMGRLVTTKGVRILMQAARILREQKRSFELLVIGEGPERTALEQFARDSELGAHVRFAGRLSGENLEAALAQAFAVVVPSLAGEVFGLVVAENMARALPVVTSDLGAFTEVLGEAGLVFRTGDPADLAAKLAQLLDDPKLAARLGLAARHRAIDFCSKRRMIDEHIRVYGEACAAAKN